MFRAITRVEDLRARRHDWTVTNHEVRMMRHSHWEIIPRIRPSRRAEAELFHFIFEEARHDVAAQTPSENAGQPLQLSGPKLALVVNH
jgi:hypothetical protein